MFEKGEVGEEMLGSGFLVQKLFWIFCFTGPDVDETGRCSIAGSVLWIPLASCLWHDAFLSTCQDDTVGQVHSRPVLPPFHRDLSQAPEF